MDGDVRLYPRNGDMVMMCGLSSSVLSGGLIMLSGGKVVEQL